MAKRKAEAQAPTEAPKRHAAGAAQPVAARSKERVLVTSSRGITVRFRHLMLDLIQLLPHSKKDAKLDTKSERAVINEVAELKGCTTVMFFEARKHKDLYLWAGKALHGPSVKFHVTNVHTMAELKLSGNHLKGSRPVLSFDAGFDAEPYLRLIKGLLTQIFATPPKHHKSKPFFDHVVSFTVADGRIWLRNYQVLAEAAGGKKEGKEGMTLVEVGPRATLNPIRVFGGSCSGAVLWENVHYVSPNALRAALKRQAQGKYAAKVAAGAQRKLHVAAHPPPTDPLSSSRVFAE